ncbi:MAG: hypothetical protein EA401_01985 [Planctomycetota bacterium]|nr:MAG: hypothetical protein EA401_01985 [Planctomycetota bacterium]
MYEWRYAVAVFAVLGILYSITLYTKAMFALSIPTQRRTRQRSSRRRKGFRQQAVPLGDQAESAAPDASTVDWHDDEVEEQSSRDENSAASSQEQESTVDTAANSHSSADSSADPSADESGDQFSLLDSLPDDSFGTTSSETAATPDDEDQDDDYDSRSTERVDKPQAGKSAYGIDPNARTRHDLTGPETDAYGVNKETTVSISAKHTKTPLPDSEAPPSTPSDEHYGDTHPNQVKTEAIASQPPSQRGTGVDDLDLLRRASRMEELGFHVGIVPARLRENPHAVSDEEKQALLNTLGQLEEHIDPYGPGTEPVPKESQGSSDVALDDILAKLDHALSDEFPSGGEAPDAANDPLAPNPPKSDAATTIIRSNDPPTQLHQRSNPDQDQDQDQDQGTTEIEVENIDAAPLKKVDHPQEELPVDEDSAPPAQEQDEAHDSKRATEAHNTETPPAHHQVETSDHANNEDLTPPPSPPPRRKPGGIPDWARADTFDEDVNDDPSDEDDGKQLDLFDKPD